MSDKMLEQAREFCDSNAIHNGSVLALANRFRAIRADSVPANYGQLLKVAEAAKDIVLGNSSIDRDANGYVYPIVWQAEWDAIRAALAALKGVDG